MKKVLLLGGSHFQVPSVKTARDLGYHVITCDYIPDNPGHKFAHEYHNTSTTDKSAVLKLSESLKIDGIVCYASDPAAPTAAYVAEQMGLPGNPYESVEILANKDKFRDFLSRNGFRVPRARGYQSCDEAVDEIESFVFPVMVKPVDSSGSKGVTKISLREELGSAIDYALGFSRSKRIIIEEFVEKFGYQIAGDGFSWNGKLVFRCFANEHFNSEGNPFVPIGESWPYNMPKRVHDRVHSEIQRLLSLLKMQHGAYNFDIRIDQDENPILMEIGPRNGGNLIPQVTRYATGVDMVAYTIKAAMGEDCSDLKMVEPRGYWSCYMIHSKKAGVFQKVVYDKFFEERNIVECDIFCEKGDHVDSFNGSNGTLGTMILKFDTMDEMLEKMDHMDKHIKVVVE
jgi:biotin carboxylase